LDGRDDGRRRKRMRGGVRAMNPEKFCKSGLIGKGNWLRGEQGGIGGSGP